MSYTTSVKVLDSQGRPTKAEINCGGKYQGFTDENTGELHFDMYSNDRYSISAKRHGIKTYGKVRGGQSIILRL